ncbi:hypothetical protein 2 [Hubei tombus-like virus 17]|uniref:hypothetical protein 2 n=1 Tax=Hubei tombus-like virus 17 TaxID=1923263 RepID=UPI00090AD5FA|nr:hypothetical protein 2 [Hubei tombus-like virus 17]APG76330.1 hypothetical protein 2 [Hubei tombus-like virus 17]
MVSHGNQVHFNTSECVVIAPSIWTYQVRVHAQCACNQYESLIHRHLASKEVDLDIGLWRRLADRWLHIFQADLAKLSFKDVISHFTGKRKKRYSSAFTHYCESGYQSKIKMFIKQDKYPLDTIYDKSPRAIQYRSPEFNLAFMQYIKPIEDWVYNNVTYAVVSDTPTIAKAMNPYQRAEIFRYKVSWFKNPKFYLIDHSAFDSCISKYHLKTTHKKYFKFFDNFEFRKLCQAQIHNSGKTRSGIKYKVEGTRMSGDADTALGNCIVNLDCITAVLCLSGISKYDIMVDGDDSIVIVEQEAVIEESWFKKLGFITKISSTTNINEVEFCQSRLCFDGSRYAFVRNPMRMLAHYSICNKKYSLKQINHWLKGISMCENSLAGQYPIYNAIVKAFDVSDRFIIDEELEQRMKGLSFSPLCRSITTAARKSFEEVWGIDHITQELIEKDILGFKGFSKVNGKYDEPIQRAWQRYQLCHESSSSCWRDCSEGRYGSVGTVVDPTDDPPDTTTKSLPNGTVGGCPARKGAA